MERGNAKNILGRHIRRCAWYLSTKNSPCAILRILPATICSEHERYLECVDEPEKQTRQLIKQFTYALSGRSKGWNVTRDSGCSRSIPIGRSRKLSQMRGYPHGTLLRVWTWRRHIWIHVDDSKSRRYSGWVPRTELMCKAIIFRRIQTSCHTRGYVPTEYEEYRNHLWEK